MLKIVQGLSDAYISLWPKDFWAPQSPDLNPLNSSSWTYIEEKAFKTRHKKWAQGFGEQCIAVDEERLSYESLYELPT